MSFTIKVSTRTESRLPEISVDDFGDHIAVEVTIDGDTASALVALGDPAQGTHRLSLTLVREDGGWKISRVNKAAASK